MNTPRRILFVCLGNIVRSPLAENLFRNFAEQEGLMGKYLVDSAGTADWHEGEPPDSRMRRTAAAHGLRYSGEAREVKVNDLVEFDLIIAMDQSNVADLLNLAASPEEEAKIRLLREFDPLAGPGEGVPDPYYAGAEGFEHTYHIVERAVRGLIAALEKGQV